MSLDREMVAQLLGISKVAEDPMEEKLDEAGREVASAALGATVGAAALAVTPMALDKAVEITNNAVLRNISNTLPKEQTHFAALAEKMGLSSPLFVHTGVENAEGGFSPAANIRREKGLVDDLRGRGASPAQIKHAKKHGAVYAHLGRGPEVIAHELGHKTVRARNKILSVLASPAANRYAPVAGMAAGGLMALAPQDAESWVVKTAPVAPLLAMTPILADEALSSIRGFKGMKDLGMFKPEVMKRARGNLIKMFGTYLLGAGAAAAPVVAATGIRLHGGRKRRKRLEEEVEKSKEAAFKEELSFLVEDRAKEKIAIVGAMTPSQRRGTSSLFSKAYKEDKDFRKAVNEVLPEKIVKMTSTPKRVRKKKLPASIKPR